MAATTQVQITWPTAANSSSISSGSNDTSEAATVTSGTIAASLSLKADNDGTPASGDSVDFWILYTNGDPDAEADSADEYDDIGSARFLCRLDTNDADPKNLTVPILAAVKGFKIYAASNAASNAITVSAQASLVG